MESKTRSDLHFNPDDHPDATLKAFEEFTCQFSLRYEALYPDPPKSSIDASISRWKVEHTTGDTPDPKPNLAEYDSICSQWKSKDKVRKVLGIYSSPQFYSDWCVAEPHDEARQLCNWDTFIQKMNTYYEPTSNSTLKNFQFRNLSQHDNETFSSFCNRVQKEAQHCNLKCANLNCTAENTAIRDQIVIGVRDHMIRQEALQHAGDLDR